MKKGLALFGIALAMVVLGRSVGHGQSVTSDTAGSSGVSSRESKTSVALESGVIFLDLVEGDGPEARTGQMVGFHYVGKVVETGKVIDDSRIKPIPNPLRIVLGTGKIIRGLEEGMTGMRRGGRRLIEIPPHLGYGDAGVPPEIPPKAHLLFDIELVEVRDAPTSASMSTTP